MKNLVPDTSPDAACAAACWLWFTTTLQLSMSASPCEGCVSTYHSPAGVAVAFATASAVSVVNCTAEPLA